MNRRSFLVSLAAVPLATAALAGERRVVNAPGGVALGGIDPVGYFTEGRPVPGREDVALMWMGAVWLFASPENRALFESDPYRYAPAYGGYCALAMSQGYTAAGDTDAWAIHDDRLYLIYSLGMRNVWSQDMADNIERANANWPAALR